MVAHPASHSQYDWLQQDALLVAPKLLGWELVSYADGHETGGRIVEVEAYHGTEDPASHAFRGLSLRVAPMFLAGGAVYTYRSYGIHTCVNIVTGPAGVAQAILIRALEPTIGLDIMASRRSLTNPRLLTSGPGRLGQALGITLADSGTQLGSVFALRPSTTQIEPKNIIAGPRIGITRAKDHPWRFMLTGSQFVSHR